jgi:hypothetical protein
MLEESQYRSGMLRNPVPVESSVLASVLYRPELRLLEVEFRSGLFYQYFDVPQQSYNQLLIAESKGAYLNANIRNRLPCNQIGSPPGADTAAD